MSEAAEDDNSIRLLVQFSIACLKSPMSCAMRIGVVHCLNSFTTNQTAFAYQHLYELFVSSEIENASNSIDEEMSQNVVEIVE